MHPWEEESWLPGVLTKKQIKKLVDLNYISGVDNVNSAVDYSSIDLHLSGNGYIMNHGSMKPCGGSSSYISFLNNEDIATPLKPNKDGVFNLKPSNCYVFKLKERLNPNLSKSNIFGQATAKSTVGRLDVIARLIVEGMSRYEYFDSIQLDRSSGELFLEIIPISFPINVKEGISLSQLRFIYGNIDDSKIKDKNFIRSILCGNKEGDGFFSVDVTNTNVGGCETAAFRAINVDPENFSIDIWKKEESDKPDPTEFWSFVKPDLNNRLTILNGKFYLLRSKERIALPSGVAVYCRAMDETLGEMRIHYAGFVHPFFGTNRIDGKTGTPLIFEVRGHNVDISLEHGEKLAKLIFYRMSENAVEDKKEAPEEGSKEENYGDQELTLSKYFKKWPDSLEMLEDGKVKEK